MAVIGYARVSTRQQDNALQLDALRQAGVERVYQEKVSAVSKRRPQLDRMLAELRPGDAVLVYKVDRLARSIVDLRRLVDAIVSAGGSFRSLTQPFDTGSSMGKLVFQLLGVLAEFERDMILERCEAGRAAARERGVSFGRPSVVDGDALAALVAEGLPQVDCARRLGVSGNSIRRAAQRRGLVFAVDGRSLRRGGA